ncbi:coenzyme F420-0:L-glutamate ligase [Candidatus Bathyarchaeota archaeon]|nr:coenzyme F420-0:L-glutamate ligase [Candidatus Bathyarchaeota archaeon]
MFIRAIKTPVIQPGNDLVQVFLESLEKAGESLLPGDIVVIAETVMATAQGRVVDLKSITDPCDEAKEIAKKFNMDPRLVQIIIAESDEILGGVDHVILARSHGLLLANAGVDASNSGGGTLVSLLPDDLWGSIRQFREELSKKAAVEPIGAILADSRVQPLKKGVLGGALAVSGFVPVEDKRGQVDLFGRPLVITQIAVADDLTSAAELLMGEANEQTPFVLIREAPVHFERDDKIDVKSMEMAPDKCLFMNIFSRYRKEER